MADLSDAQRKRAESRQRRRVQAPDPSPGEDESKPDTDESPDESHHGVRQAAKVAAAVGAAGAAAAAARALTSHDDMPDEEPALDEEPAGDGQEPQTQAETAGAAEGEQRDERPEAQNDGGGGERQEDEQQAPAARQGEARATVDRAKEQLESLIERPVESVSSLERTHNGWVVALEVVEVSRIPETTDILASYELELDNSLDLVRYQQVRRYHRAQASRGEGA
jgi:hypothetical protein